MAAKVNGADPTADALPIDEVMAAILGLMVAEREERLGRAEPQPTEVVLADAGLDYATVARLTGRPYNSVKTTIRRGREARTANKAKS